jgi:protein-tyrosine phosphatase
MSGLVGRIRSFWKLEWIGEDDLYAQAFSEITPTLFLGRRPTPEHVDELQRRGVTQVVSCLEERRRADVEFLDRAFDQLFLPANDQIDQDLRHTLGQFFAHIDTASATKESKLLVHCEVGVSRSASLVIALLMRDERLTFLDAFERVRSKRVQVLPNLAFASQLQRYEHELELSSPEAAPSSLAIYLHQYCSAPSPIDELDEAVRRHDFDAPAALRSIYGGEIPRVVQGARSAGR